MGVQRILDVDLLWPTALFYKMQLNAPSAKELFRFHHIVYYKMTRTRILLVYISVICLVVGPILILAEPLLTGEEWTYRKKSLSLINETVTLLTQYSKSIEDYDSWSRIIDSQAHVLTPPQGYENFHEQLTRGVHAAYDLVYYELTLHHSSNETERIAALNEANYARTIMPDPSTPEPLDVSVPAKIITLVGAAGLVALITQSLAMGLVNLIAVAAFAVCNLLDWAAASAVTHLPCDWSFFSVASMRAILPNLSAALFLATQVIVGYIATAKSAVNVQRTGSVLVLLIATVVFMFFNFWDFNSLGQMLSDSTGTLPHSPLGFLTLSLIVLVATVGTNLYLVNRLSKRTLK